MDQRLTAILRNTWQGALYETLSFRFLWRQLELAEAHLSQHIGWQRRLVRNNRPNLTF